MFEQVKEKTEILNKIFDACNTLRHVMDPSDYKDYILTTLFVKYISDLHEAKRDELVKEYGDNKERIKRKLERELFVLDEESTFDYLYKNREADNIGELINQTLKSIENSNYEKLNNVFRVDFNSEAKLGTKKQKNQRLKTLLEDFHDVDFKPYLNKIDLVGDVYEYLIGQFAADAGKGGGEFYTPAEVAKLAAKILAPKDGDTIYDPTCGSGSLLLKAAAEVGSDNYYLYGQEVNSTTWALAKMNMFLHGVSQAKLECDDTINAPQFLENDTIKKFDKVIANPPFSKSKWTKMSQPSDDEYGRFHRGLPPKSKGDWAFVTHMVESLKSNGKAVIVVPLGVLFRGAAEGSIRKSMIDENLIEAVIGLSDNLFFGTSIPAALLVLNKAKNDQDILFVEASKLRVEGKRQNSLSEAHIDEIIKMVDQRKDIEKKSALVSINEIAKNEYNLNIPRYVDTYEEEEIIDIEVVQAEIKGLEDELAIVSAKIKESLKELTYEAK